MTSRIPAIKVLLLPKDTNALGTIFGGVILSHIDLASAVEARKSGAHRYVTKAIHTVEFHAPVYLGDIVNFFTETTRIGRTSITVKVSVEAERWGAGHRGRGRSRGRGPARPPDPDSARGPAKPVTDRIRVGILLGGASEEREISLASGLMIAESLPKDRYEVRLLDTLALMAHHPDLSPELREKALAIQESRPRRALPTHEGLAPAMRDQVERAEALAQSAAQALANRGEGRIDVAFLALHGKYGEDGTLQGFLEMIGTPYTGSGVLASALAMDKVMAKRVLSADGIPVPRGIHLSRADLARDASAAIANANALLPAVVKPSKQGSSVGMSLVDSRNAMEAALRLALDHDDEVLIEERIFGTEITVGVLGVVGNSELQALPVVEIVPKRAFFDYQAKYDPDQCEEICPARISEEATRRAQELGRRAHRSLGCRGYSRTDMILGPNGPVVLEVNTLPGMTMNSLLPKAAAVAGIPFGELLHRIVSLALQPRG